MSAQLKRSVLRFSLAIRFVNTHGRLRGQMGDDRKVEASNATGYGGLRISLIKIGLFLLFTSFCFLVLFLQATITLWVLLILVLPLHVFSEWLTEKVFAAKYGWSTEQVGFSPKRIAFGVLLVLVVSAGAYLISRLFN